MFTDSEKDAIYERFKELDASNVSDVLDELGHPNHGLSPEFVPFSGEKIAGWAYTIAGEMSPYEGTGDPKKMEACNGIGKNEISVWSGNGEGICYFGELIAIGMMERGSVGALIEGGVRDIKWLEEHGYPTFARYRTPVQSIGRWRVTSWQEDVYLPGATAKEVSISPGDFILGDVDGVIAVPQALVKEVLERTEALTEMEVKVREALASGKSLAECLEEYGHV